jgi:Family of unknown function (DUF6282)
MNCVRGLNISILWKKSLTALKTEAYTRFRQSFPSHKCSWGFDANADEASSCGYFEHDAGAGLLMPDSEGGGTAEKRLHRFATQPGPDWNRESHGEWAGMKSYLGAGYAPYGLDKSHRGSLSGAALDRIRLIAKHDVVFATGHLGRDEIFAVVRGARELGVRKVIVTHAEFPSRTFLQLSSGCSRRWGP